jgi:hypothetical protein
MPAAQLVAARRADAAAALPFERALLKARERHKHADAGGRDEEDREVGVGGHHPTVIPKTSLLRNPSAARVRVAAEVDVAPTAVGNVRVELGRPEIRVAEHLLDAAQVGSPFE